MKSIGIVKNENEVRAGTPKKNIDLMVILTNIGLIDNNPENMDKINDFHDYLFKLGIEIGVAQGKKMIIDAIKEDRADFNEIIKIDPEHYTAYDFEPTFISDMKEAISNEK